MRGIKRESRERERGRERERVVSLGLRNPDSRNLAEIRDWIYMSHGKYICRCWRACGGVFTRVLFLKTHNRSEAQNWGKERGWEEEREGREDGEREESYRMK